MAFDCYSLRETLTYLRVVFTSKMGPGSVVSLPLLGLFATRSVKKELSQVLIVYLASTMTTARPRRRTGKKSEGGDEEQEEPKEDGRKDKGEESAGDMVGIPTPRSSPNFHRGDEGGMLRGGTHVEACSKLYLCLNI